MQYFIFAIILLIYSELVGRWVLYKLNKETYNFNYILGFGLIIAIAYLLTWPITLFKLTTSSIPINFDQFSAS